MALVQLAADMGVARAETRPRAQGGGTPLVEMRKVHLDDMAERARETLDAWLVPRVNFLFVKAS